MLVFVMTLSWSVAEGQTERGLEGRVTVAAASHVKTAMNALIERYGELHPGVRIAVTYGASGKITTQILNGAPFDLFFSADMAYPGILAERGETHSGVKAYAVGRLVLWQRSDAAAGQRGDVAPGFDDLIAPEAGRIALANPRHAPYGQRAREVLIEKELLERVESRLVFGKNVAQAAQFAQTGAADFGMIALSLALTPTMQAHGSYTLVPADLHQPLEQGFILLSRAEDQPAAVEFARFVLTPEARTILAQNGFEAPEQE